jgi:hypothetical protein
MLAIGGMVMATTIPQSGAMILLPTCLGGFHPADWPLKEDGGPAKCPGACHAVCCRSRNGLHFDDGDQET